MLEADLVDELSFWCSDDWCMLQWCMGQKGIGSSLEDTLPINDWNSEHKLPFSLAETKMHLAASNIGGCLQINPQNIWNWLIQIQKNQGPLMSEEGQRDPDRNLMGFSWSLYQVAIHPLPTPQAKGWLLVLLVLGHEAPKLYPWFLEQVLPPPPPPSSSWSS